MKFKTLIAGNLHDVSYTIRRANDSLVIHKIYGDPLDGMRNDQLTVVMARIRKECREHAKRSEARTLWSNGVSFKEYFKLRAEEGDSLVFEISDFWEYCQGAKAAALESINEAPQGATI